MKNSLFKKEITKKEAGALKAGSGTTYENTTFDMCRTVRYNLILGFISDSEFCTDTGTYPDPVFDPPA